MLIEEVAPDTMGRQLLRTWQDQQANLRMRQVEMFAHHSKAERFQDSVSSILEQRDKVRTCGRRAPAALAPDSELRSGARGTRAGRRGGASVGGK